jgi:hypothetical protein
LRFGSIFVVDCVGRSGGLALFWNDGFEVAIQNFSRRHINAVIKNGERVIPWKFTGFYGHSEAHKRKEAWSLVKHVRLYSPTPWLCAGDFNEILEIGEKTRRKRRPRWQMEDFHSTLEVC